MKKLLTTAAGVMLATSAFAGDQAELEAKYDANADHGQVQENTVIRDSSIAKMNPEDIEGKPVVDLRGEELGDIDEVVIRANESVAVVGLKGIFGDGAKEVIVTFDELRLTDNGEALQTNLTREQLEARPDYDPMDYQEAEEAE